MSNTFSDSDSNSVPRENICTPFLEESSQDERSSPQKIRSMLSMENFLNWKKLKDNSYVKYIYNY